MDHVGVFIHKLLIVYSNSLAGFEVKYIVESTSISRETGSSSSVGFIEGIFIIEIRHALIMRPETPTLRFGRG